MLLLWLLPLSILVATLAVLRGATRTLRNQTRRFEEHTVRWAAAQDHGDALRSRAEAVGAARRRLARQ